MHNNLTKTPVPPRLWWLGVMRSFPRTSLLRLFIVCFGSGTSRRVRRAACTPRSRRSRRRWTSAGVQQLKGRPQKKATQVGGCFFGSSEVFFCTFLKASQSPLEPPRVAPSPYISPRGLCLVETSRICDPQAARGPLSPPAENALFGSIFDFLKNTPQADLSGFEVPPGA